MNYCVQFKFGRRVRLAGLPVNLWINILLSGQFPLVAPSGSVPPKKNSDCSSFISSSSFHIVTRFTHWWPLQVEPPKRSTLIYLSCHFIVSHLSSHHLFRVIPWGRILKAYLLRTNFLRIQIFVHLRKKSIHTKFSTQNFLFHKNFFL